MKMLVFGLFLVTSAAFAAENCIITVPAETTSAISKTLESKKGFNISDKATTHSLVFDNFMASPIYEIGGLIPNGEDDLMISVSGSVIMKIYRHMENGKKDLQFALKMNGSISTCYGRCIDNFEEGKARLYAHLLKKLGQNSRGLPNCRSIN